MTFGKYFRTPKTGKTIFTNFDGINFIILGSFAPNGACPNLYDDDDVIVILEETPQNR